MLSVLTIPVTPFEQNCKIVFDDIEKKATVIDPGGDIDKIVGELSRLQLTLEQILLTHAHIDHAGGVSKLLSSFRHTILVYAHREDSVLHSSIQQQAIMFGLSASEYQNVPEGVCYLEEGSKLEVAGRNTKIFHTPGHAPGHLVFFFDNLEFKIGNFAKSEIKWSIKTSPLLIAGDTLFEGSVGRTDLPGGSHAVLIKSIKEKLMTLPDDTVVMPGHGGNTTIGRERSSNPFLN